jgi:hypothetical protein
MSDKNEGWGWPGSAAKAHYFRGSTSLCRKWMWTGQAEDADSNLRERPGPDDCTPCWRAKKAEQMKAST